MATLKTSLHIDLASSKLRLSRTSGRLTNWKHQEIERLPELKCDYAEDDKRFLDKKDQLFEFSQNFWDKKNSNSRTHQEQYEFDLRQGVFKLLEKLHAEYQDIFEKDFENNFK
jgi:hypothetical protein